MTWHTLVALLIIWAGGLLGVYLDMEGIVVDRPAIHWAIGALTGMAATTFGIFGILGVYNDR